MSYYHRHLFFCTNLRENSSRPSCASCASIEMRAYAKQKIKSLGMSGQGKIRVNSAACLDRCKLGPVCVVYPEGVWYTYVDEEDIDEIIDSHLLQGKPVERLKLPEF